MRRTVARGRVFPQAYSVDRRYGRLTLKAVALFPLLWSNADDQGRLSGDPDDVKYTCCPGIDHITKADIPTILQDLASNKLILLYETPKSLAIQFLDWWEVQRLQWALPSEYPPPEGWADRLRYHPRPDQIITENWVAVGQRVLPSAPASVQGSLLPSTTSQLPQTPTIEEDRRRRQKKKTEEEEGRSPSTLGSNLASPSPVLSETETMKTLTACFKTRWGKLSPEAKAALVSEDPYYELTPPEDRVTPRKLDSRGEAQLRDLAKELSSAGGATEKQIADAFDEAVRQQKLSISYVRAIILDWLGVSREKAP